MDDRELLIQSAALALAPIADQEARTLPAGHAGPEVLAIHDPGGVALERQDPNGAIELLKVASTAELGEITQFTILRCPAHLRGEAYLMLHDGNTAAAELQKFIDHRGVVMNFPWGALVRLGLARAYAKLGDTAKARAAYHDFFTLWIDADPDIPVLKQAKAEYARLP